MYLTLNISSKEIRLLAINNEVAQHWAHKELPSGWVKDGSILEPKGVGAIMVSLLESFNVSKTPVAVCISGLPFTYRITRFPHMKRNLLKDSVRHFMRKETSMPIEQMYLSWAVMDESSEEVELLILGVDQKIIDTITATMKEAKIKYWTLDLKALALARAASLDNGIVVSAESDYYDIVIIDKGTISTIHTVSTEENQENIKHSKQLLIETSKAITYDAKKRGITPKKDIPLLLTGELSCQEDIKDSIQNELGYNVTSLSPPFAIQPDFPIYLYSTNIGLAMRESGNEVRPLSKEPTKYRDINLDIMLGVYAPQPKRISAAAMILPVALTFGICLALPIYIAHGEHEKESLRLQNELALVNQQIEQAQLNEQRAAEIQEETDGINKQIENLRKDYQALFGNQGEMADTLRVVVNDLPDNSYFNSLGYSPETITLKGWAEDTFQAVDYTKILEEEGLFHDVRIQQITEGPQENGTENAVNFEVIINK